MLGTIRADGSPRLDPIEPFFIDGELVQRADHPDGDFPAVRDENAAEHQTTGGAVTGSSSNRSCPNSTGSALPT